MDNVVKVFFLVFSTLFPIVNPLSASPFFFALTKDIPPKTRRVLSLRIASNSFLLMIGSHLIGAYVLRFFGVSLPVVQVGGGLVVISLGWTLLTEKEEEVDEARRNVQSQDIFRRTFYPLTLPLTVGPGSISVAVTLGANFALNYGIDISIMLAALIAMGMIAVSIFICYGFADRITQMLGEAATSVVIRLSAFLLLCIGVQIVWNGISALLSSVPFHFL